jgi:transketolase
MRKEVMAVIEGMADDKKLIFITGDLGYNFLESTRAKMGERFINAGVAEQNMIGFAAGLASEGLKPVCYSITPFLLYRPFEQIKVDLCLNNKNVKLIGAGAGYIYGNLGATHHALEDIGVMSTLPNMRCYIPFCGEDATQVTKEMMKREGPCYLRLGTWAKPDWLAVPPYKHTRRLIKGEKVTVISMGQVVSSAIKALDILKDTGKDKDIVDLFIISEMPLLELTPELKESLKKTKKLIVIEEHVERGGLGENLTRLMMAEGISCEFVHLHAKGYPNGLYGSLQYHYKISGIDENSVVSAISGLIGPGK